MHIDDLAAIINNTSLNDFSSVLRNLKIQPIIYSFLLAKFGNSPVPFHFVSILIHALNGTLVYLLAKEITNKKIAFFAALLFLVHPINSEVVSWVSGSAYLYQAFFWILTLIFFIKYRKGKKLLNLLASITFYVMYFITAGSIWGIVVPFVALAMDLFVLNNKLSKFSLRYLVPFVFVNIVYFVNNYISQIGSRLGIIENRYIGLAADNRLVSVSRVLQKALILLPFPFKLNVIFGYFEKNFLNIALLLLSFGIILFFLIHFYKNNRLYFGLLLSIFVAIAPILIPIRIGLGYADRYLYFSSIFFSIFIIKILFDNKMKIKKELFPIILVFIFTIFGIRTFIRTLDWHSDETIWKASLAADSSHNYEAYNELGNVYYRKDMPLEALEYYGKAIDIRPLYPDALYNIGLVFIKGGQFNEAELYLKQAVSINTSMYESYYRLGQVAIYQRDFEKARSYYNEALRINPNFTPAQEELELISKY